MCLLGRCCEGQRHIFANLEQIMSFDEGFPFNATLGRLKQMNSVEHVSVKPSQVSPTTVPDVPGVFPSLSTNCNVINSNAFSPRASCHWVKNLCWLSRVAIDLSGWVVFKRTRLREIYWVITLEIPVAIIITIAVMQAHEQEPSVIHLMAGR